MPLGESLSDDTILAERAKALVPLLDAEAEFADNEGELSPAAVAALHRDGLLKLWVPEKLGGAELDPVHSLEVLENLSYADASAGWVTMAANLSIGTAGAYLSDHAVAELWGDGKQPVIAGQGTRPGTAKMVDGGLLLSGSWSFGSGLKHSSHVHSLGIVEETGEPRIFVTPIEAVNLIDNWDVMGLRGTGSIDYTMESVFVPEWLEPLRSHHDARARRQPVRPRHHRLRGHLPQRLGDGRRPSPARRARRTGARQGRAAGSAGRQRRVPAGLRRGRGQVPRGAGIGAWSRGPTCRRACTPATASPCASTQWCVWPWLTSPRRCTRSPASSTWPEAPRRCAAAPFNACSAMCTPAHSTSHRHQTCGRHVVAS